VASAFSNRLPGKKPMNEKKGLSEPRESGGNRFRRVRTSLNRKGFSNIEIREERNSIVLEGILDAWHEKIEAGYAAARRGYKGVVNDIEVEGIEEPPLPLPGYTDGLLEGKYFDAVVIGGGIIGTAIARELTRTNLSVALLEKEDDVAMHASSRNDGMIHPGFAPSPGSVKAGCNVRGNEMYTEVCRDLDVPIKRTGSLVLFHNSCMALLVPFFKRRCRQNGVRGARYLTRSEVFAREPYVSAEQHGAFFLPTTGQLSPYRMTLAYAENAVTNGAAVFLRTGVSGFEMDGDSHIRGVKTNRGTLKAGIVVNAAGVWSDVIAGLAGDRFFSIHGRKGVDALLDTYTQSYQSTVSAFFRLSHLTSKTKGGGVVPTVEGNLLVGPTAFETADREDYSTSEEDIDELLSRFSVNTKISRKDIITYFAGIRACTYEEDFIVEASERVNNLVHAAGIQSPGVASAPAIAEDVAALCKEIGERDIKRIEPNPRFDPKRKGPVQMKLLKDDDRALLIRKNPSYGRIVCRCEEISEGEIRDVLRAPLPIYTLDGIKRRTRAGMGRCQGGFCTPRVMEILHEETGEKLTEITKKGMGSNLLYRPTKDGTEEPE